MTPQKNISRLDASLHSNSVSATLDTLPFLIRLVERATVFTLPQVSYREHPRTDVLLRFLRGEANLAEKRAVVRHLLAGCRECVAVTRPVWELAERLGTRMETPEMIEGARQEMRATAEDLKSIRYRLLGVHAGIPPSPLETSRGDLEGDPDVETELRTVIANGIQNCLDPLIEDLLAAAEYQLERA